MAFSFVDVADSEDYSHSNDINEIGIRFMY